MCWICDLYSEFAKFSAYIKHFVSLSIASFIFVTILVGFDIFRLQIDHWFVFLFRVISYAFFNAMLDENWVDFFSAKSIFSIESSNVLNAFNAAFVEFILKILFVDVEVSV